MPRYEPLEAGVEVLGSSIISTIDSFPENVETEAKQIFEKHGINNPSEDEWYPHEANLAAMSALYEEFGPGMLEKVGRDKPKNIPWPPEIETATDAIMSIDEAYRRNHRNGEIGGYHAEQIEMNRIKLICDNPYPCPLDEGIIEGVTFEFAGKTAMVSEIGDECREEGGKHCTYEVKLY